MIVERLPEVLALPTEEKEILAEELLDQVVLEKDKIPQCSKYCANDLKTMLQIHNKVSGGRICAIGC